MRRTLVGAQRKGAIMPTKNKITLHGLMLVTLSLLTASAGYGQVGSLLGQVTFSTDCGVLSGVGSGVGVGITFDGTNLWYSCYNSKNSNDPNHYDLKKADPKTGTVLASYDIAGGLGALAYDATRNVIWAGEGGGVASNVGVVITIPLDSNKNVSGAYQVAFPVPQAYSSPPSSQDIVDGLAIDGVDDTLYIHYDFATEIAVYNAGTGAFIGFVPEAPGIQSGTPVMTNPPVPYCVVSGVAIGGNTLFEASDYCDYVWAVDKATQAEETASSFSVASSVGSSFDEKALTCDTSTFGGNDAIWVKGAFSPQQAYAFEVSPNSCGVGGQPATASVNISPSSLTFANQAVGTTSAAQAATLSNSGNSALSISSIAITGTNSGDFAQTNNCGASLAANSSCTINVTFTPAATGARTGTLTVTDNASNSPQTVSLSGTGMMLAVSVSPSSLSFGNQQVNTTSAPQAVTLSNSTSGSVTINSIAIAGTNSGDFAETNNCSGSLAAGASCTINVTFTPTAAGSRTATLTVTDNASNSPQTVSLSGTGVSLTVNVSPSSLSFGNQQVNTTSEPKAVTLSNTGSGSVTINSMAIAGANSGDFAETNNCGGSLPAGASCTVNVTFMPTATGSRAATLAVTDNASNSPQSVNLSGTGTAPTVSVSPTSLSFGTQLPLITSPPQTVTVKNTGYGPVTISSITISGSNAGDFAQSNNCGSSLAAGASCTISVTFTPTTLGNESATLNITDDATGSPQTVSLSGTGGISLSL
jgi:centrosomal CEP192-like protein